MKLDFDQQSSLLNISSYSNDGIYVGGVLITDPFVLVGSDIHRDILPQCIGLLESNHIEELATFRQSIILIGTGAKQRFLEPDVLRCAYEAQIGVETMNSAAACRSFNVLVAENRSVLGAFYMP